MDGVAETLVVTETSLESIHGNCLALCESLIHKSSLYA